jgi:hypothetical protein
MEVWEGALIFFCIFGSSALASLMGIGSTLNRIANALEKIARKP